MLHSATVKRAEKVGVTLKEDPATGEVEAFWPQHNVYAYGIGTKPAMDEMEALQKIKAMDADWRVVNAPHDKFHILVFNADRSRVFDRVGATPKDTLMLIREWLDQDEDRTWPTTAVPDDGAAAHAGGFTAADNPYRGEDGEPLEDSGSAAEVWDSEFDQAADAAEEPEEAETSGSVVKSEYRIRYAEAGHPNHCGDWLAVTLNNLVLGKTMTDLAKLEELFLLNNADTSKYDRTRNGWQGRIRMTGRNLLAKQVYMQGKLLLPPSLRIEGGPDHLVADADWMAKQRFKGVKKAEPVIEPVKEE